jgi:DNA invertase Pin-like site-specific DNA recombinase
MTYVALYCRISKDKNGRTEGVRNQERWGREYAAATWPGLPVRVFVDNNISAAEGDHRPGFEDLREALPRGEIVHLWTVEQSRLERREAEWFRLAAEMDAAGLPEIHTKRDGIVRVRDEVAGIKAVINAGEVRKMKARINDRLATNAARGLPPGSRPFGYRHGINQRGEKTLLINEDEASIIRESAELILAGWSLGSIAANLRSRGVHGPHRVKVRDDDGNVVTEDGTAIEDGGKPVTRASVITNQSVRSWMSSPTIAGRRVHRGVEVGKGNWTPILDENTWRAVDALLKRSRTVHRSDGGTYAIPSVRQTSTGRRYLLTGGIAVCAVCNGLLSASMKQLSRKLANGTRVLWKVAPYYLCNPNLGGKACVGVMGDLLEAYVTEELFKQLDKPAFREALMADTRAILRDSLTTELEAIRGRRGILTRRFVAGELAEVEWDEGRDALATEETRVRDELGKIPVITGVDPGTLKMAWNELTLDEQRHELSRHIQHVRIRRATPGLRGFEPGRVSIDWRWSARPAAG